MKNIQTFIQIPVTSMKLTVSTSLAFFMTHTHLHNIHAYIVILTKPRISWHPVKHQWEVAACSERCDAVTNWGAFALT